MIVSIRRPNSGLGRRAEPFSRGVRDKHFLPCRLRSWRSTIVGRPFRISRPHTSRRSRDDLPRVGSVSNLFTDSRIMQLAEQNKLPRRFVPPKNPPPTPDYLPIFGGNPVHNRHAAHLNGPSLGPRPRAAGRSLRDPTSPTLAQRCPPEPTASCSRPGANQDSNARSDHRGFRCWWRTHGSLCHTFGHTCSYHWNGPHRVRARRRSHEGLAKATMWT